MKKLFIVLILFSFVFAETLVGTWPRPNECSMPTLLESFRSIVAVIFTICILFGITSSLMVFYLEKKNYKKIRGFKIEDYKMVAKGAFILGVVGIIIYLLAPTIFTYLFGVPLYDPCNLSN